jgi:hypothetical protein
VRLGSDSEEGLEGWLLVRESLRDPEALAYFLACAPVGWTRVAGRGL